MRIAIDIRPIDSTSKSQHKVRGVGKYISLLKENIEKYDGVNSYEFTSDPARSTADVIHYPYFDPFFVTLPIKSQKRTVITVHDLIPLVHKKNFPVGLKGTLKWQVNKMLLKKADAVITDSVASKEDIHEVVGIESRKIFPVYLSADEDYRQIPEVKSVETIEKYGISKPFFLYVGDVTWNKNLPRIVEAVKRSNASLVMVGKALIENGNEEHPWNSDRKKINSTISNDSQFVRLGYVPINDLVSLYNNALALLMPSLDEGFGLPVLEAMKSGCPVITSKCGSLPEVGQEGVHYVDAYSVSDIEKGLEKVAADAEFRKTLIEKGRKQAEKFSLKKMIKETVDVYNSIH